MKKFLLSFIFLATVLLSKAQFVESFNGGALPAGWDLAQGMKVQDYNNPSNNCVTDFGLLTPGVGGNNPAKVLTGSSTYNSSASFINVGFTIYIFDANLACSSVKALPCQTFVQVYLVKASWTSASVPPATEILAQSLVQIVQSNTANILYVPTPGLTSGTQYRVLYDFSVAGTCNQNGTKYILDEFKVITTVGGPLPVVLGNFNAQNKNGKVSLTWETFQEVENDGFEIQRRAGNGRYETVAFVDSKVAGGTGSGASYSFDDNAILGKAVTYYRLRQIDLNGKSEFSEVKALRGAGGKIIVSVYPNPSLGTTNIVIPEGAGKMDVSLDDFTGKSVQRWSGLNVRNLQITNLKPGMYLLRITIQETGEQISERITVQ